MDGEISGVTKTEVLKAIRNRYRKASKKDKSRMLDEFVAIMGCHRKHAVRLLRQGEEPTAPSAPKGQRIYGEAVREMLTVVWEASDRICGKRLKAALPSMVESLERHGHLDLDPGVRRRLFSTSAATIERLMRPIREQAGSRRKRKQKRKMAGRIPVRTISDWKEPEKATAQARRRCIHSRLYLQQAWGRLWDGEWHRRVAPFLKFSNASTGRHCATFTVFDGRRRMIEHNDSHSPARQNSNLTHEPAHGFLIREPAPALDNLTGCRN